jgi:hypothetical protein
LGCEWEAHEATKLNTVDMIAGCWMLDADADGFFNQNLTQI